MGIGTCLPGHFPHGARTLPPSRSSRARGRLAPLPLALAAAVVLPGCERVAMPPPRVQAPVDSAAGEVPFRLVGPGGAAILVRAVLNGRDSVDLIVDTGATLTCVDDRFARELQLPEQRGVVGTGIGVGGSGRVRLVRVDSLRVGAATARNLSVCSLDLAAVERVSPGVRGLLGLNFLRSFRVTFDFRREVMLLAPAR